MLKRSLVVAVPCLVLLSGCGVAETQFHPGVAAEVGDRTITTDRVDDLTSGFCAAIEDQIAAQGQAQPLHDFEVYVVDRLALQSAVEQIAEDYDVQPGSDYTTQSADRGRRRGTLRERPG